VSSDAVWKWAVLIALVVTLVSVYRLNAAVDEIQSTAQGLGEASGLAGVLGSIVKRF
jgi:hypothetical protein